MSTLTINCSVDNVALGEKVGLDRLALTTAGDLEQAGRISVGTSEETITTDVGITNVGPCVLINRDDTNFIDIGFATGVYPIRILPGGCNLISLTPATATLYLKADTAACELTFKIYEA